MCVCVCVVPAEPPPCPCLLLALDPLQLSSVPLQVLFCLSGLFSVLYFPATLLLILYKSESSRRGLGGGPAQCLLQPCCVSPILQARPSATPTASCCWTWACCVPWGCWKCYGCTWVSVGATCYQAREHQLEKVDSSPGALGQHWAHTHDPAPCPVCAEGTPNPGSASALHTYREDTRPSQEPS